MIYFDEPQKYYVKIKKIPYCFILSVWYVQNREIYMKQKVDMFVPGSKHRDKNVDGDLLPLLSM